MANTSSSVFSMELSQSAIPDKPFMKDDLSVEQRKKKVLEAVNAKKPTTEQNIETLNKTIKNISEQSQALSEDDLVKVITAQVTNSNSGFGISRELENCPEDFF